MKMRKLLSIGALTLTLVTCTSMSAFAAEGVGNRNEAAKTVAKNAWKGTTVINNININIDTAVNKYITQALIDRINNSVKASIADEKLALKVSDTIQSMYKDGKSAKEIFEALQDINQTQGDITTDKTFDAAKGALNDMLVEFINAKNNGELGNLINKYFKVSNYGTLSYGINSNNRQVVTLNKNSKIIFQVSSENIFNLKDELENRIHSWADLKDYFLKIQ